MKLFHKTTGVRSAVLPAIILLGVAFAGWQWLEYQADVGTAHALLQRQAEALTRSVIGAIRSHRRLGTFFHQQIQTVLDELVASKDLLAVAVADSTGKPILTSGTFSQGQSLPGFGSPASGLLIPAGYFYCDKFEMQPLPPGGPGAGPRGFGRGGRWGRPERPSFESGEEETSPFAVGGTFWLTVLLDRSRFDSQVQRARVTRLAFVLTGWLTLAALYWAFQLNLRAFSAEHGRRLAELQAQQWQELSQAASGLAHEIRNPLGLIRGWAQRIAQRETAGSSASEARLIVEESDRLAARLTQFLSFARPFEVHPEPIDLDSLVEELLHLVEPDCQTKSVRCVYSAEPKGLFVKADRDLLRQALFNLLHNAIKYTKEGSTVSITAQKRDKELVIEVADQGPGVPEDDRPKLFTPYFSTDPQGTGLGLSIVRKISAAHGWRVGYHPSPQGGAVFSIKMPNRI